MLGRVRASSISSLELLEMERPSSKTIKHDPLSIYESTLLKLKQGSHSNPSLIPDDSPRIDAHCTMTTDAQEETMTDAHCSSSDSFPNSSCNFQSTDPSKGKRSTNMSILYMFSKYKNLQHAQSSTDTKVMAIESGSSSLSSFSPTSKGSPLLISSSRHSLHQENIGSPQV